MNISTSPPPSLPGSQRFSYSFRVFISYAHADIDLVLRIVGILESLGLQPLWDKNIRPGTPFTDAIKGLIARSHVFIPLITENSQSRPWIHQEAGYAIALNIPVVPIAIGDLPSEMIASLQAISVSPDLKDLPARLHEIDLERLVLPNPPRPRAMIEIAEWPEKRAEMMVGYAQWVIDLGGCEYVRHLGTTSTFSIPDCDLDDPIWKDRDGTALRSDYYHYIQREERRILERHARGAGCSLIIDPTVTFFNTRGPNARRARLVVLRDFIASMSPDKLRVVMSPKARRGNIVIVGDYFAAESQVPRPGGYRQTIFNSHPPTVLQETHQFDQEFEELYATKGVVLEEADARLEAILKDLPHIPA
jgi:hypothetical protein